MKCFFLLKNGESFVSSRTHKSYRHWRRVWQSRATKMIVKYETEIRKKTDAVKTLPCSTAGTIFHLWVLGQEKFSKKIKLIENMYKKFLLLRPQGLEQVYMLWRKSGHESSSHTEMPVCMGAVAPRLLQTGEKKIKHNKGDLLSAWKISSHLNYSTGCKLLLICSQFVVD